MLTRSLTLAAFAVAAFACAAGAQAAPCGATSIYTVALPGASFSAIPTADDHMVFVSINATNPRQQNGIAVLACVGDRYRFERVIPLETEATVMAMTADQRTLVAPDDNFIAFVDVAKARSSRGDPIAGYIEDIPGDDGGAVYAAVSPDDRYAVVAEEQSAKLSVIDLRAGRTSGYAHSSIVSEFLIGNSPVATVFSRDGKYLFVTVQSALKRFNYEHTCEPEGGQPGDPNEAPGAVMVVDVAKMASDPDHAIVANNPAGCHPVRAALSPDGQTLWVTARKSNAVLGFATDKLISGDATAKIAEIAVGAAPVPVFATRDGKYVLAGNSNRFGQGQAGNQAIVVIDAHTHAIVGQIQVGKFPRQFTETRSGSTIFLANYGSNSLTVINPASIPSLVTK